MLNFSSLNRPVIFFLHGHRRAILMAFILASFAVESLASDVQLTIGPSGLDSLLWQGREYVVATPLSVTSANFSGSQNQGRALEGESTSQGIRKSYERLDVSCKFSPGKDRLGLEVQITNKSELELEGVTITLGTLVLSSDLMNTSSDLVGVSRKVDNEATLGSRWLRAQEADIELVNEDLPSDAYINVGAKDPAGPHTLVVGLKPNRQSNHPVVDNRFFQSATNAIAPNSTKTYRFSLRFSPAGSRPTAPGQETAASLREKLPMKFSWPDRRPIGALFLANPRTGWKSNPRGYVTGKGKDEDVFSEEGLKAFRESLLLYADKSISILKDMDAQGVIVWDLEGAEFYHPITYLADPEKLPQVAPEMERCADAFFQKFREAGLKTGITIRPTDVVPNPKKPGAFTHVDVADPIALMIKKISYAKKRWGCTIFYLDSDVFGKDWLSPEDAAKLKGVPWVMPTAMIEAVMKAHPDILLIPEWSDWTYSLHSAPYASVNLGQRGSNPAVRKWRPESFQVVSMNSEAIEQNWDVYRDNFAGGDIPLVNAWYETPEKNLVKLLREEASYRAQGLSGGGLKTGDIPAAVASGDPVRQYQAALSMGQSGDPANGNALVALLDSSNDVVRKAALQALSQLKSVDDATTAKTTLRIIREPKDRHLASFAAAALGASGPAGEPLIIELLGEERKPHFIRYGLKAASTSSYPSPAIDQRIVDLLSTKDEQLREFAISVAGLRKQVNAVPALIASLGDKNESISRASVAAQGQIGDPSAIPAIIGLYDREFKTVVIYSIRRVQDEALRSLTGTRDSRTADGWKEFTSSSKTKASL